MGTNGIGAGALARAGGMLLAVVTGLLVGCSDATGPGGTEAVSLSFGLSGGSASPAPGLFAAELQLSDGTNTLVVQSAELVLRELELEKIETAGCDSEPSDDNCEEFEIGPFLVSLPLDGSTSQTITAQVDPGIYDEIEFDIHKPEDNTAGDLDFIAANPNFADISIRVTGTYNGQSFLYTSDLNEEQEIELTSPLTVGSEPTNVTLTIDISTWFASTSGALIDPRTANKGEPNEQLVKNNIRLSIEGFRDDDHDGMPHDDDPDESIS
ncbi:MAG: hypothetical protein GWN99_18425 [Gemmatimonadetes bacterium]|uniref:DUF4382 domain-containing protein n=1 Tax=Candidatus Kutchimonas denitrificans TaxID=3056748 RepID=A0AAE5CCD3_9BACT|nr:hypothetical protein [Gemmatimonadota bacterium]NIR74024.1 hypothetical protein [Candidatus Kutchimonas denitrificans]NIS03013.1 hypothetical protein [Gemmatimonadota bacterium]NIT68730.1 hypothetical protein [Gemmatimonadota bacterium]NIU53311.1 hypothetical protein [Gemmatimonadota bacterium]